MFRTRSGKRKEYSGRYLDRTFDILLFEGSMRGSNWTENREASAPEVGEYLIPHSGDLLEREQRKLTQTQDIQSKYESLFPMFIGFEHN